MINNAFLKHLCPGSIIVLKFGTSSVCTPQQKLRIDWMETVGEEIARLRKADVSLIIFTSGGLACGRKKLIKRGETELNNYTKQMLGAIGLSELMFSWQNALEKSGLICATLLLRAKDIKAPHVLNSLQSMLRKGITPVINENIPLQQDFDNDQLAAAVAQKLNADAFILFTDTYGVYDKNPRMHKDAIHIPIINSQYDTISTTPTQHSMGSGGMQTKLVAAKAVASKGIPVIITNGQDNYPLSNLNHPHKFTIVQ